jgi:hypothetical protein
MSTVKISALPAASGVTTDDVFPIVNAPATIPETQKATAAQVATFVRAQTGAIVATGLVGSGATLILNPSSASTDVRIAGDANANTLFVKGSTDCVGILNAAPTTKLDITGTGKATALAGSGASLTNITASVTKFQSLTTDPSPLVIDTVWYNTTSHAYKCVRLLTVFTASSAITTARANGGGVGTPSAALVFGGEATASTFTTTSEKWNGSAWSSTGAVSADRRQGNGCGTSSSALTCGGYAVFGSPYTAPSVNSEKYNGTSWSTTGSQIIGRGSSGIFGTATDALVFSGYGNGTGYTATSEVFNGSTWASSVIFLLAEEGVVSNAGASSTSGITTARYGGTQMYSFNGITWSTAGSRTAAVGWGMGGGTATAAIGIGGTNNGAGSGAVATSEAYNGATWSASATMGTARYGPAGGGTSSTSVLVAAGKTNTTYQTSTEILSQANTALTFTLA